MRVYKIKYRFDGRERNVYSKLEYFFIPLVYFKIWFLLCPINKPVNKIGEKGLGTKIFYKSQYKCSIKLIIFSSLIKR